MDNLNIFQQPLRGLIVGSTGQGKSTFLYNLIKGPLHKKFHKIFLFIINKDYDPKYKKMGIKQMYDDYDIVELEKIFMEKKPDNKQWLIILDDCISEKEFSSNSPQSILNKITVLGRLRGISLIVSVQKCRSASVVLRSNINWLVCFPTIYDLEIKAIYDICAINKYPYFKRMFHDITKDSQYNAFLYDRRKPSLFDQIYQLRSEASEGADPDLYEYKIFKYKYDFEY